MGRVELPVLVCLSADCLAAHLIDFKLGTVALSRDHLLDAIRLVIR